MKISAYIFRFADGLFGSNMNAVNEDGSLNGEMIHTLVNFIFLLDPELRKIIMALLTSHEAGTYHPEHPEWADFGINDINMWIREPFVESGHVLITNKNTEEYSEEYGTPQRFTVSQFRQVMAFWEDFLALVEEKGKAALLGQKFEREIT